MDKPRRSKLEYLAGFIVVTIALLGCAGHDAELASEPEVANSSLNGIPMFPLDPPGTHSTNVVTDLVLNGSDEYAKSAGAIVAGQDMELNAGASIEFAIYEFATGVPGTDVFSVTPNMNVSPGNDFWVGLSDYGAGQWAFSGPFTSNSAIPLDTGNYLSSQGNFYFAVIATPGNSVMLSSASLNFEDGTTPGVTYVDTAGPFLTTNCATCHSGSSPLAGVGYDSFRAAKANATEMISKVVTNDHRDLSPADKDMLQAWVDGGTLYGAVVTYDVDIQPIVQNNCTPCHTSGSSGGVNLNTFAGASAAANQALSEILAETMPASGGPLTEAQKDLWQVWIDDGKPEN